MNIQEKERVGMYYWLGIASVLAIMVLFLSKMGLGRELPPVVLPTAYPTEVAPTPAVNWGETQTVYAWKENGNEYKTVGYVRKSGMDGIYKNGEKYIDVTKLHTKGEIGSMWMSEENKVIFVVEDSTEQFSDGSIDFSNQIVKINLPDYERQTVLKEPVPAFHGGLGVYKYYPVSKELLVVFGSGGACSLNSEIWLVNTQKMTKRVIRKTEFSECGNGSDGGTQNLGFDGNKFVFLSSVFGDENETKLSLYDPATNKEEVILMGEKIPGTWASLDRDKNTEVIFMNEGGEKARFDTKTRTFVKE